MAKNQPVLEEDSAAGPRLYDMAQLQTRLRVSKPTIYELIHAGTLQTLHIGARRFCTPEQLQRCIDALEKKSASKHERRAR